MKVYGNSSELNDNQIKLLEQLYSQNKLTPKYLIYTLYTNEDFENVHDINIYAWMREKLFEDNNYDNYINEYVIPICKQNKYLYVLKDMKRGWENYEWVGTAKSLKTADVILIDGDNYHEVDFLKELLVGLVHFNWYNSSEIQGFEDYNWLIKDIYEFNQLYNTIN